MLVFLYKIHRGYFCSGDSLTLGYAFNWTSLSAPSRKRSYVSRSCQSLSLTRSMERKSGLLLSRFQAWPSIELAKRKVSLKQEMCSMLQPPYFHCVLLVSLLPGWWKVWDPNHFLSLLIFFLLGCITYFIGRVLSSWFEKWKASVLHLDLYLHCC